MSTRRDNVPFDAHYFEKRAHEGQILSVGDTFRQIYEMNHWSAQDSVSGAGASRSQTEAVEAALPPLLEELGVRVLLDLPCGDFSWMRHVDLPVSTYIGADIVPELIERDRRRYENEQRRFVVLDLTRDPLPEADLILCRDCLVHLSFAAIFEALENLRKSRVRYLLTTTFPGCDVNEDITMGDWRVLNLERPPFSFPPPLRLLNEQCSEGAGLFRDKSLGLWRTEDLPH